MSITEKGPRSKQDRTHIEIEILNEFFCDDCIIKDKVTEKAVEQFISHESSSLETL